MAPSTFQNPRMAKKYSGIAQHGHDAMRVAQKLCDLRDTAASDKDRYEYGRRPIRNDFCFHRSAQPPNDTLQAADELLPSVARTLIAHEPAPFAETDFAMLDELR